MCLGVGLALASIVSSSCEETLSVFGRVTSRPLAYHQDRVYLENQSARGGLLWEVYKGKYDRS